MEFSHVDTTIFLILMFLSTFTGFYFGVTAKNKSTVDYIFGGKKLNPLTVAASLIASYTSGTTFLGVPGNVYQYGSSYAVSSLSLVVALVFVHFTVLPVLYNLQLTSVYEYLNLRFGRSLRTIGSSLFAISMILVMPIIIYAPSLALSQITGVNTSLIIPLVSIGCVFYTLTGGMKAVVWTDLFQGIVMLTTLFILIGIGFTEVGFQEVFRRANEGGRLRIFEMSPDPTIRDSFWAVFIGNIVLIARMIGTLQSSIQRFISTPTLRSARWSLWVFGVGDFIIINLSVLIGLITYAKYSDCDPVMTNKVEKYDQLIIYFVTSASQKVPGLLGIFMAGIFSAALSTVSTNLNSLSATIFEDFVAPWFSERPTDAKCNKIMKIIVLVLAILSLSMAFAVEHLGDLLELTYSSASITAGTMFGLFILGIFLPWANGKGALVGAVVSITTVAWIVFGAKAQIAAGKIIHLPLATSIAGCSNEEGQRNVTSNFTTTYRPEIHQTEELPFFLYRISYWYYTLVGTVIVITVGMIVSAFTGLNNPHDVNLDLIAPQIAKHYRKTPSVELQRVVNLPN